MQQGNTSVFGEISFYPPVDQFSLAHFENRLQLFKNRPKRFSWRKTKGHKPLRFCEGGKKGWAYLHVKKRLAFRRQHNLLCDWYPTTHHGLQQQLPVGQNIEEISPYKSGTRFYTYLRPDFFPHRCGLLHRTVFQVTLKKVSTLKGSGDRFCNWGDVWLACDKLARKVVKELQKFVSFSYGRTIFVNELVDGSCECATNKHDGDTFVNFVITDAAQILPPSSRSFRRQTAAIVSLMDYTNRCIHVDNASRDFGCFTPRFIRNINKKFHDLSAKKVKRIIAEKKY